MKIIPAQPVVLSYPLKVDGTEIGFWFEVGHAQPIYKATFKIYKSMSSPAIQEGDVLSGNRLVLGKDTDILGNKLFVLITVNAQASKDTNVRFCLDGGTLASNVSVDAKAENIGDVIAYEVYYRFKKA